MNKGDPSPRSPPASRHVRCSHDRNQPRRCQGEKVALTWEKREPFERLTGSVRGANA